MPGLPALFTGLAPAPLCVERTAGAGFEYDPQCALLLGHHADGPGLDTSRAHARPGRDPALNSPYAALTLREPSGILFNLGISPFLSVPFRAKPVERHGRFQPARSPALEERFPQFREDI